MPVWNLENIHDIKDTDKILADIKKNVDEFKKVRPKLNEDLAPADLVKFLQQYEELKDVSYRVGGLAELWTCEDSSNAKANAHRARVNDILTELGNETVFFSLWFTLISDSAAKKFIGQSGKYKHFLEVIRLFKDHTLPEKEEQIISLLSVSGSDAVVNLYDIVTNRFLFDWAGKKVGQSELTKNYTDQDPSVRKAAYTTVLSRYKDEEPILGEIYTNIVRNWRAEGMKLRKFESPISRRNLGNEIPDKAVDVLLQVVKDNAKLFQDYFKLKFKLLKIDALDRFHLYAPYEMKEKDYPFEDCKKAVLDAYDKFSPKMGKMAREIFDANQVHSELTPNKRTGAFCFTITNKLHPYILLNHAGKLNDLVTMMHEFGHGIHSVCAKDQTLFTAHAPLPLAETASIFGELILLKQLLKGATDEEKIYLITKELDKQYASIGRQAFFVLFEVQAHEMISKGCTLDELNAAYRENLIAQFGKDMRIDELFNHEWKYIPHMYHTPFYCYAYAFGNLLVLALYRLYEKEGESFVPKYLKLLSYGGSKFPEEMLSELGIDMFSKAFWQQGFDIIKEEVETLKKLIK